MSKRDVDRFGLQDPSLSSILITISVDPSHITKVTELDCIVQLKGIKSDTKELHIIRSFSPRKYYMFTNNLILTNTFIEDGTTANVTIATLPQLTEGTDHNGITGDVTIAPLPEIIEGTDHYVILLN